MLIHSPDTSPPKPDPRYQSLLSAKVLKLALTVYFISTLCVYVASEFGKLLPDQSLGLRLAYSYFKVRNFATLHRINSA